MNRACLAIVDVSRARIVEYDVRRSPGDELKEIADLVNPGRRHLGNAFEEAAPADNIDQKFAKEIVADLERIVREGAFTNVVVVAGPRMLGELRKHDSPLRRDGLQLDEIERDLAWQSNAQLHDHLASMGILPPRQRMAAAR